MKVSAKTEKYSPWAGNTFEIHVCNKRLITEIHGKFSNFNYYENKK